MKTTTIKTAVVLMLAAATPVMAFATRAGGLPKPDQTQSPVANARFARVDGPLWPFQGVPK